MKQLLFSIFQSNRQFRNLLVVIFLFAISILVILQTVILPTVSKKFFMADEVSLIDGNAGMTMTLSQYLNDMFTMHVNVLTETTIQSSSPDNIQATVGLFSTLPGVKSVYCLIDGIKLVTHNSGIIDNAIKDSLINRRQIFEKYRLGPIDHPKKFHEWVLNKIRFDNLNIGADTLRLIFSAFDSTGNYFKVIPKDEFEPSMVKYLIAIEIDEEWLHEAVPKYMDREFYGNEIFGLWSMADPNKNEEEHGAGVLAFGDTLWWVGLKPQEFKSKSEGSNMEWMWPGHPWFKYRTVTRNHEEYLIDDRKALNKHRIILYLVDGSAVLLIIFLMTVLILIRKQWLAKQIALAHLAHSIKTPIARMRLNTDVLTEERVASPVEENEIVTAIGRECGRLERAVQNASLSLERGKRAFNKETCDLNELVTETAEAWQSGFDRVGIRLSIETDNSPLNVSVDREMIAVALDNLIDNALRHTTLNKDKLADGEAKVTVNLSQEGEKAVISVDDMGGGIPKSDRDKIFKPFTRAKDAAGTGVSGLGLGLALVKEIAEGHGGGVKIENNDVGGSKFIVTLPIR